MISTELKVFPVNNYDVWCAVSRFIDAQCSMFMDEKWMAYSH